MSDNNINIRDTHNIGSGTRELIVNAAHCAPLSLYGIPMTGISDADPHFCFVRQRPAIAQILACVGGAGEVWLDGGWTLCEAGCAYATPAGVEHAYRSRSDRRWRVCWVQYDVKSPGPALPGVERPTLLHGNYHNLEGAIDNLYREEMGAADPGILFNWASLIHAYVQRSLVPRTRLAPLWDALKEDLAHEWTVAEMADRAHVSSEHLRRLSEQEVGVSPMRHLTRLRMREAAAMLYSDSYKMHEIAQRVGYDNVFAFSTAFKRCFGQPPSVYRAQPPRSRQD